MDEPCKVGALSRTELKFLLFPRGLEQKKILAGNNAELSNR